jgi:hypothetical protein
MHYYSAKYTFSGTEYSSFIHANTEELAKHYIKKRNIGETIIGILYEKDLNGFDPQPLSSDLYREGKLIPCCHCLTFYSWIASRAGLISAEDELSDKGMVHELLHELDFPNEFSFRFGLYNRIVTLEHSIPGLKANRSPWTQEMIDDEIKREIYHGKSGRRHTDV